MNSSNNSILNNIWNTVSNGFNRTLDTVEQIYTAKNTAKLRRLEQAGNADRQAKLSAPPAQSHTSIVGINPMFLYLGLGGLALALILRK